MVNRILVGKKRANFPAPGTPQREKRFAFRHKTIREFRGRSVVVRFATAAQVENERIDLFPGETAQRRIHFQELVATQISGAQIPDVVGDDLPAKRRGRRCGGRAVSRQKHDAACETAEQAGEDRALQFLVVQGRGINVAFLDDRNCLLQIRCVEEVKRRGRRGGRFRGSWWGRLGNDGSREENR